MVEATRDGVTARVVSELSGLIVGVKGDLAWKIALAVVDALVAFEWSEGEYLADVLDVLEDWDRR